MKTRICEFSLIVAALSVIISPSAIAQQSYPDLKGTWIGPGQSVTQGKTDQWPNSEERGPVFREGSWTPSCFREERRSGTDVDYFDPSRRSAAARPQTHPSTSRRILCLGA